MVAPSALEHAAVALWQPFISLVCIMMVTEVAGRLGLFELLASRIQPIVRTTAGLFGWVFVLSGAAATVVNNDVAVVMLTPVVITMARRLFPRRLDLLAAFALAVFLGAGAAPLSLAHPLILVASGVAGADLSGYALLMLPVALAGWFLAFGILRVLFAARLGEPWPVAPGSTPGTSRAQWAVIVVLGAVLVTYPIAAWLLLPAWGVAVVGALGALWIGYFGADTDALEVAKNGISWGTLILTLRVVLSFLP